MIPMVSNSNNCAICTIENTCHRVVKIALIVILMFLEYMGVVDEIVRNTALMVFTFYSIRLVCFILNMYFLNRMFYEVIYSTQILFLVR